MDVVQPRSTEYSVIMQEGLLVDNRNIASTYFMAEESF